MLRRVTANLCICSAAVLVAQIPACRPATPVQTPEQPPSPIEEIGLERIAAMFLIHSRVTIRADGSVRYTGNHGAAREGTFTARVPVEDVRRLGELVDQVRFAELEPVYGSYDDAPEATVSVRRRGVVKQVEDSDGSDAPVGLWGLEMAIDGVLAGINDWSPVVVPTK